MTDTDRILKRINRNAIFIIFTIFMAYTLILIVVISNARDTNDKLDAVIEQVAGNKMYDTIVINGEREIDYNTD